MPTSPPAPLVRAGRGLPLGGLCGDDGGDVGLGEAAPSGLAGPQSAAMPAK